MRPGFISQKQWERNWDKVFKKKKDKNGKSQKVQKACFKKWLKRKNGTKDFKQYPNERNKTIRRSLKWEG